jgi:hypothetical protein
MSKKCKNNGGDDFFKFFMLQKLQEMEKMQADSKVKLDQIGQALGLGFNQVAPQNAQAFGNMLNGMPQLSPYSGMINNLACQRSQGTMLPTGGPLGGSFGGGVMS